MIDGTNRHWSSRFWHALAMPLVRCGLTPNQVTWAGLVLVIANCAAYVAHQQSAWLGFGFIFSFAFDSLDGAVARITGKTSKYGGYLDAVIDRYQELAAYLGIAYVTGWWPLAFFALSGSLLVSYNKARTALEIPIDNYKWPDLMERFERIFVLCAALILDPVFTLPEYLGTRVLFFGIAVIAVLAHFTAVQRFMRARALLLKAGDK